MNNCNVKFKDIAVRTTDHGDDTVIFNTKTFEEIILDDTSLAVFNRIKENKSTAINELYEFAEKYSKDNNKKINVKEEIDGFIKFLEDKKYIDICQG